MTDGCYTVSYRIVSADGHPVFAEHSFELNMGSSVTTRDSGKRGAETDHQPESEHTQASQTDGEGSSDARFIWLLLIMVLLGGGVLFVLKVRKSKG